MKVSTVRARLPQHSCCHLGVCRFEYDAAVNLLRIWAESPNPETQQIHSVQIARDLFDRSKWHVELLGKQGGVNEKFPIFTWIGVISVCFFLDCIKNSLNILGPAKIDQNPFGAITEYVLECV